MSLCAVLVASLTILLILLVAALAFAAAGLTREGRRFGAAIQGWATGLGTTCITNLAPSICANLLATPAAPPDPRRPPAQGFDGGAATYAARIVGRFIAYLGGSPGSSTLALLPGLGPPTFTFIPRDAQPLAATWVTPDGGQAVIAIRGTATVADLVADLEYGETDGSPLSPQVQVHHGMNAVYLSAKASLFSALPASVDSLFIAGHSLGAAVAFLYAFDASARPGLTVEVHGLAPPRVGNTAFASQLAARARTNSLINLADGVPTLPWSYMPNLAVPAAPDEYAHVQPVYSFNNLQPDIISCHDVPAYFDGILAGPAVLPQVRTRDEKKPNQAQFGLYGARARARALAARRSGTSG